MSFRMSSSPPEPIFGDYVEMATLTVLFIIGAPLNLAAYTQLAEKSVNTRLDLLRRHLNYTDLLVIFIYVPSRVCWLVTYDWRGGDSLCRIVKTLHTLAFQSSSNVIVCIALDRLLSVLSTNHSNPHRANMRTKWMLVGAWLIAGLLSLPQLLFWRNFLAFPDKHWSQCLQIWEISRSSSNPSLVDRWWIPSEQFYLVTHLAAVFWIPTAIIMLSYMVVLSWVWLNSKPSLHVRHSASGQPCDTQDTLLTKSEWRALKTFSKVWKEVARADQTVPDPPMIVVSNGDTLVDEKHSIACQRASLTSQDTVSKYAHVGNSQSYNARINRSRALRISFLLVTAYVICWLPYNFQAAAQIFNLNFLPFEHTNMHFLHDMMVLNAVINPFIYGFVSGFRKGGRRSH